MKLNDILYEKNMSMYRLSKLSSVPQSTISDLCSGKLSFSNITVGNAYKIASTLDVSIESLLQEPKEGDEDFELYRSNICHELKELGYKKFITNVITSNRIEDLFERDKIIYSLYLLSMVDYELRIHGLPYCDKYEEIRKHKLTKTYYPNGIRVIYRLTKDETVLKEAYEDSIPEFKIHNIVENDIENIA